MAFERVMVLWSRRFWLVGQWVGVIKEESFQERGRMRKKLVGAARPTSHTIII
jgi:hypothetical protein